MSLRLNSVSERQNIAHGLLQYRLKAFRLVITGNPGAGKHTSARLVADRLGAEIIDINKVALENNAVLSKTSHGADVDIKKLSKLLATALKKKKGSFVIVGHLAPYVLKGPGIDMAAVLRRSPNKLESTLAERKYTREKINENVSAEILGILLYDAIKAFGKRKVGEFDTTNRTPEESADQIVAALQKKSAKKVGVVDWLAILSEEEVQKFFAYQYSRISGEAARKKTGKGEQKSQVAVQHGKLAGKKDVERMKKRWHVALDRREELLGQALCKSFINSACFWFWLAEEAAQEIHAYSDAQLEKMQGNDNAQSYDELLKYVKRYGMHRHFDISYQQF